MLRKLFVGLIVLFGYFVAYLIPIRPWKTLVMASRGLTAKFTLQTRRGKLRFALRDREATYISRVPEHEPETFEFIEAMPEGSCFWDIGANIGVFSLYAALCGQSRVLAFEPSSASYAALNRNIDTRSRWQHLRNSAH